MGFKDRKLEKLSNSEKKDILQELETEHLEMRRNQAEVRRRWIKTQGAVEGRQLFTQGGSSVEGVIGMGWEQAGVSSATNNVDEETIIFNDLRRVYNTDMQRLTSYYIRPEVVPESKNSKMKMGARMGRIFLADHIAKTGGEAMKQVIARNLILRNICIMKVHFDPHAGRMIKKPKWTILGWQLGTKWEHEGEMVWDFPNPKCVLIPKYCPKVELADKVEEYHVESIETVYRKYGVVVEAETIDPDYYDALDAGLKSKDVEGGSSGVKIADRVVLKEKIIMPCPAYPEGAMFTWTSKQLIRSDKLRYPGNPYFTSSLMFHDETAYSDSVLWDLMPIQAYLNLGLSAVARWMKTIAQLRRWVPSGANIKKDDLNDATGMNTVFDGPKPPEWDKIPEINESIWKSIELARDFIASHGYSNELAKQKRAMSGNALGILQEVDDTIFKPCMESVQSMLSRASQFTLQVASSVIDTPRLIRMSSMQGWQIVEGFKGEMLEGNFYASISLMTGLPTNKVMRLEYLTSIFKAGLIDKPTISQFLEFPSDNQALEDAQKQYEIADKRIQDLLDYKKNYIKGVDQETQQPIMVCQIKYHQFDNHDLMVIKLQVEMQENFDHWNPWIQIAFLEHWKYHKDQQAAEQQAQLEQQLQANLMQSLRNGKGSMQDAIGAEKEMAGGPGQDSNQNGQDQPSREQIPQPMASGFTR